MTSDFFVVPLLEKKTSIFRFYVFIFIKGQFLYLLVVKKTFPIVVKKLLSLSVCFFDKF